MLIGIELILCEEVAGIVSQNRSLQAQLIVSVYGFSKDFLHLLPRVRDVAMVVLDPVNQAALSNRINC